MSKAVYGLAGTVPSIYQEEKVQLQIRVVMATAVPLAIIPACHGSGFELKQTISFADCKSGKQQARAENLPKTTHFRTVMRALPHIR